MGKCEDCIHVYSGEWGGYYCSLLENSSGEDLRVKPGGSCNSFSARPNAFNSGYSSGSSGSSGCFLTSACVEFLGKEDDCYELTTLRNFRDTYLAKTSGGENLIKEYYEVAPSIVEKINSSGKEELYYSYIYSEIQKCIENIEKGKNEEALLIYEDMVKKLKESF